MNWFRSVSKEDVESLAETLDLTLAAGEARAAVDRIDALAAVYTALEDAPGGGVAGARTGGDRFEVAPYRPPDAENTYNQWLTRFELSRAGATGDLDDLDVALKDNMCVCGVELTCGSRALERFVPGDHATVVDRLLDAGATVVGKTNMDEFAFGPTANPADTDHVAGGSSAGSAAAVAAGEVDLALGSDTGGSIRMPANYCGIVGVKPSYGLVPLYGVAELAYSMDHVGTLARDVGTAARGLDAIADAVPGGERSSFSDDLGADPEHLHIGIEPRFFERHVADDVERSVRDAIADLRQSSSRNLGTNVTEMLLLGTHLLQTHGGYHYVRGQTIRARLDREFDAALADVDVLVTPTTPTTALEIDGFERGTTPPVNWDTHPTNLTGHPSVSVPCGKSDGLPVGLQFIGAHSGDATVLDAAATVERVSSFG